MKKIITLIIAVATVLVGQVRGAVIATANFTGMSVSGATSVAISGTPGVNEFSWSRLNSGTPTLTFSSPSVNLQTGTANALKATIGANSFEGMIGTMNASTTIAIGQTLTLSFIGQYTEALTNTTGGLRFGFINSADLDNSFGLLVGTGGSTVVTLNRDSGGDDSPIAGTTAILATGSTTTLSTSVFTASFSISRTDTDTYSYLGNINGYELAASNIAGGFTNYNAIVIRNGNNGADFQIDNVSVSLIPEPSVAILGCLGLPLLLRRRR